MFKIFDLFKRKPKEEKSDNDNCEFEFMESIGDVLEKRYDREARAHKGLSEKYDNLDELPKQEYHSLMREETDKICLEDETEDRKRKKSLCTIRTLRGKKKLQNAIDAGQNVLKQEVKASTCIKVKDVIRFNTKTFRFDRVAYDYYSIMESNIRVIKIITYYPYKFPKEAAYLLPKDLEVGERVVIEDLIEDIVGASHSWGTYRLDSAEAVWNGKRFIVDCDSYDVDITFG